MEVEKMKKELDKSLSALVLVAYAALWALYWIVGSIPNVPSGVLTAISIIRDVALCLMYFIVLYNALGWSGNLIVKLVFCAIALFLIFCAVAKYIPVDYISNIFAKVPGIAYN